MKSLQLGELFLLETSLFLLQFRCYAQLNYTFGVQNILIISISNDGTQTRSWEERLTIREILIINEIYQ